MPADVPGGVVHSADHLGRRDAGETAYATWYSACDGVIIPYTSTRLSGAANNNVLCQTHIGYLADTVVLGEIADFIAS